MRMPPPTSTTPWSDHTKIEILRLVRLAKKRLEKKNEMFETALTMIQDMLIDIMNEEHNIHGMHIRDRNRMYD